MYVCHPLESISFLTSSSCFVISRLIQTSLFTCLHSVIDSKKEIKKPFLFDLTTCIVINFTMFMQIWRKNTVLYSASIKSIYFYKLGLLCLPEGVYFTYHEKSCLFLPFLFFFTSHSLSCPHLWLLSSHEMSQGLWFHSPSGWGTLKAFDFSVWHAPWLVCLAGPADGRIVSARVYEKCCVSSIFLTLTSLMISCSCLWTCESGFMQVHVWHKPY